jgi:uncharacterized membrane protein YdjX (TVP38/TMEM64 family)
MGGSLDRFGSTACLENDVWSAAGEIADSLVGLVACFEGAESQIVGPADPLAPVVGAKDQSSAQASEQAAEESHRPETDHPHPGARFDLRKRGGVPGDGQWFDQGTARWFELIGKSAQQGRGNADPFGQASRCPPTPDHGSEAVATQILLSGATEFTAVAVGNRNYGSPISNDPLPDGGARLDHVAGEFVSQDRPIGEKASGIESPIGSAESAGGHGENHIMGSRFGLGQILHGETTCIQNGGSHQTRRSVILCPRAGFHHGEGCGHGKAMPMEGSRAPGHGSGRNSAASPGGQKSLLRHALPVFLVAGVGVLFFYGASWLGLDRLLTLEGLRAWVDSYGPYGPVAFAGLCVLGVLLYLPEALLLTLGGVLFGSGPALFYGWIAAVFATSLTFFLGRYLARDFVRRRVLDGRDRFAILDARFAGRGFLWMLLLRSVLGLAPPLNWAPGVSQVSFAHYFAGTALGLIPNLAIFAFFGGSLAGAMDDGARAGWSLGLAAFLIIGLVSGAFLVSRRFFRESA